MAFGMGGSQNASGAVNSDRLEAAIVELDMVTDVFNKMVSTCYNKCINQRFAEGELTKGESVCVDRCVLKFVEANKIIGEKLQSAAGSMTPPTSF